MTNFVQPGSVLTFPAPSGGVVSGRAYVFGTLVGVATVDAAETVDASFMICGVFSFPKAGSQAWTAGAAVYVTAATGVFTTTAGGNVAAGIAVAAVGAGAGETTGLVLLNGLPAAAI
jgi:predicted RecA/RadA family phage recombinase